MDVIDKVMQLVLLIKAIYSNNETQMCLSMNICFIVVIE